MRFLLSIAAVVIAANGAATFTAELPTYEVTGFPISPVQIQVVGASNVQAQSPTPSLTLDGMPASLHQVSVLMPRHRLTTGAIAPALTTTGLAAR